MTLGFGLFIHLDATSSPAEVVLFQLIAGLGTGICYSGPLLALQSRIPVQDNGTATSTFGFIRNLATAVSVVIGGVVFQNSMESQKTKLTDF